MNRGIFHTLSQRYSAKSLLSQQQLTCRVQRDSTLALSWHHGSIFSRQYVPSRSPPPEHLDLLSSGKSTRIAQSSLLSQSSCLHIAASSFRYYNSCITCTTVVSPTILENISNIKSDPREGSQIVAKMNQIETYRRVWSDCELPMVTYGLPYPQACAEHIKKKP